MRKAMAGSMTRWLLAVMLVASGWAQAVTITDSGVTSTTTQYLISAESTVSYAPYVPGWFGGEATGPFSITGSFTATISNYWWDYFQDGDPTGSLGTFRSEASTIQFSDPVINGAISPSGFEFPTFAATVTGNEFSGDVGTCPPPLAPDTSCTGFHMAASSSYSGRIAGKTLSVSGFSGADYYGSGFNYSIQAAAVPEPSTVVSLTLGLAILGAVSRYRRHSA